MSSDSVSIDQLRDRFRARLAGASTSADLKALHDEFLSRKSGVITSLMKTLGTLEPEQRRSFGQLVNALKVDIETALEEKRGTFWSSSQAVDSARKAAETRAFEKLVGEIERFWDDVLKTHRPAARL